jgi:two-component system nitrate/nitrite response regulator NarL
MKKGDGPRGNQAISVLIIADVRLYREGLAASLSSREQLLVFATSASGRDAAARARELAPDVVIVDIATRDSLELIRDLREDVPTKILAFAVEEVTSDIVECAEAGASGYVTADASIDELVSAIERIAREELVCSPRVTARLFGRISERPDRHYVAHESDARPLTPRERQVLQLIRHGHSNKEIAQTLCIAEPTVKNHVHHLFEKLEVTTRTQAATRAAVPSRRRRPFGGGGLPKRETG